ncbi:MAG TPA: family 20 glycosylhydrolase, partial [Candidatus Synoicihabitans sp.]|nr:family 20 glycosylhydrolase [Candidatus Synoicihabitans sp.]
MDYALKRLCRWVCASGWIGLFASGGWSGATEPSSSAAGRDHSLLPAPTSYVRGEGRLEIQGDFRVALLGHVDNRLAAAVARLARRWEERTGFTFPREATLAPFGAVLVVECGEAPPDWPRLGDSEAYTLEVRPAQARLRAATVTGVLRGLETWNQLLMSDAQGFFVPAVTIEDEPRFPWRGLMIDVCRHWQPVEVIKRQLDGMAVVKLNVLHLHLTDDQGFRIESRTHPRLHQMGSDGLYYSHHDIREIIAYAAGRGIRVVPEFDLPGHTTSWFIAYPALGSRPGPYQLVRTWGIFDATFDPTNESVYALLDDFIGEMATLFPDPYLHIGGDEVSGQDWDDNPRIQEFIRERGLVNNAGLQTYFNQRLSEILTKRGKRMIGWDEIMQPGLPTDAVVQSWRGPEALAVAARAGYASILSHGFYLDLMYPASRHYAVDPLPADTLLTPVEQQRILGGEATMWSEWVSPETIDSRIWPRTAAIGERLWSPRDVRDEADMYRRLAVVSQRLEEIGLLHQRNVDPMVRRFAGDRATPDDLQQLRLFVDVVEPVKEYQRNELQRDATQYTPLTGLADIARPDSTESRTFADDVWRLLTPEIGGAADLALRERLQAWTNAAQGLEHGLGQTSPRVREQLPLIRGWRAGAGIALAALNAYSAGREPPPEWEREQWVALDRLAEP